MFWSVLASSRNVQASGGRSLQDCAMQSELYSVRRSSYLSLLVLRYRWKGRLSVLCRGRRMQVRFFNVCCITVLIKGRFLHPYDVWFKHTQLMLATHHSSEKLARPRAETTRVILVPFSVFQLKKTHPFSTRSFPAVHGSISVPRTLPTAETIQRRLFDPKNGENLRL